MSSKSTACVGGESPFPLGVDLPVHLEEQPGPEAIEVCNVRGEPTFEVFRCP